MVPATALLLAAIIGGFASTYLYDAGAPLRCRLAAGTATGFASVSLVGFVLAMLLGLNEPAVILATVLAFAPALAFGAEPIRRQLGVDVRRAIAWLQTSARQPRAVVGIAGTFCLMWALWSLMARAMIVRADGAIDTGVRHNYGDLPFHLAVVSRFVAGNNLPPEHPAFAGAPFTYPFLTDFLSAMLVTIGADLVTAIVLPSALAALAFVVLLHQWTLELTNDVLAAWFAPVLMVLGGGLGWWILVQEVWQAPGNAWSLLSQLSQDYSIRPSGIRFGNVVTTLLIPQRGITLGLPLSVVVFRQWWLAIRDRPDTDGSTRRLLAAGAVAGVLPLVHGHSYIVVMGMAACLALLFPMWRAWMAFFVLAVTIGAPQLLWLAKGSAVHSASFVGWSFGWDRGETHVVAFWVMNTGALLPLLVWALAARNHGGVPAQVRRFYWPFLLCFLVPNVIRLAPWIWDNIKVLVYWFVASTPLVSLVLARWYRTGGWYRALSMSLALSLTAAGALDLWRVFSGAAQVNVLNEQAVAFAKLTASATDRDATVLHAPIHNHSVSLSGRRSLMGYAGHVWSQGVDPGARDRDIRTIYAGGPGAKNLLSQYGVDFVVVGDDERRFTEVDEAFFAPYPVVATLGAYRLHRVNSSSE